MIDMWGIEMRTLKYFEAVNEAIDICMQRDRGVYLMGLGVPDPKGIFGTTAGLERKHPDRVFDMPIAENCMTGVALGAALEGMRPILTHQRVDFSLLAMDQMVNQAANWHYMFGGRMKVPVVIRMIIGRGWGQGPQHSQALQAWFAHVPGLKVVMPAFAYDVKGMMIAAVEDNNPVIFLEHRWLYNTSGSVPEGHYAVPLGKAKVSKTGKDITIVSYSYMTLESLRAAEMLDEQGISAEVIDLGTIKPIDMETILASVSKTRNLLLVDLGWKSFGVGAEIVSTVAEKEFRSLQHAPGRIALPDCPTPTSPGLSKYYYPLAADIVKAAGNVLGAAIDAGKLERQEIIKLDIPDPSFTGPF